MIKKILVSQPKPAGEKSPYYDLAKQFGVDVVFRPFIKVVGITEDDFRKQRTKILDYTAVIFTSRHSIDHFFNMANVLKIKIPATMRYFCVTEAIALYIQKYAQYRKRKIFAAKGNDSNAFRDILSKNIRFSLVLQENLPTLFHLW